MHNRCILYKGQSQYDVLDSFNIELRDAFIDLGYDVIIFDLRESFDNFFEIIKEGVDFIVAFNLIRLSFDNIDKIPPLYEYIKTPLIGYLVDSTRSLIYRIKDNDSNIFYTCSDLNNATELIQLFPEKSSIFLPLGGSIAKNPKKMVDRTIDVLFCGTYTSDYEESIKILKDSNSPFLTYLFNKVIDVLMNDHTMTLQAAWNSCTNADPNHFDDLLYIIDTSHRILSRVLVLEILLSAGITITCYGNGWENSPFIGYKNFIYKPAISYFDFIEEIGNSKIVLNSTPTFKHGTSERVFSSILSGAVSLTDENEYLKQMYTEGEDILYYYPSKINKIPEIITDLLNDNHRLETIAENAYKKTINNHTWKDRAKGIIDYVDMLHKTNRIK